MSAKLSYEAVRRLARIWFAEAREKSDRDEAEVERWTSGAHDASGAHDGRNDRFRRRGDGRSG